MEKDVKQIKLQYPEEAMVQEIECLVSSFEVPKPEYKVLSRPDHYKICDINQKYFFLEDNLLVAAPQNNHTPGLLVAVLPNRHIPQPSENKCPIFIGLRDRPFALCCVASLENQPQLRLTESKIIDLYLTNEESKNFTFYAKHASNLATSSFESAAFPGWFLSTSCESNQPLGLSCQGDSGIVQFYLDKRF